MPIVVSVEAPPLAFAAVKSTSLFSDPSETPFCVGAFVVPSDVEDAFVVVVPLFPDCADVVVPLFPADAVVVVFPPVVVVVVGAADVVTVDAAAAVVAGVAAGACDDVGSAVSVKLFQVPLP